MRLCMTYLDRIILVFMLILLVVVLINQINSYKETKELIVELEKIEEEMLKRPRKPIEPISEAEFNAVVLAADDRLWLPPYTGGSWSEKSVTGSPKIYSRYSRPPKIFEQTPHYFDQLETRGPGTLFDPPVYVYAKNKQPRLLDFGSLYDYESPFLADYLNTSEMEEVKQEQLEKEAEIMASLIKVVETKGSPVPLKLKSVNTAGNDKRRWSIYIEDTKTRKQRRYSLGKKIAGTNYTITNVDIVEEEVNLGGQKVKKRVPQISIARAATEPFILKKDSTVYDPILGMTYRLTYYPTFPKSQILTKGGVFKAKAGKNTLSFALDVNALNETVLVLLDKGKKTDTRLKIDKFSKEAYDAWKAKQRKTN